jgi:hypothetical protein
MTLLMPPQPDNTLRLIIAADADAFDIYFVIFLSSLFSPLMNSRRCRRFSASD